MTDEHDELVYLKLDDALEIHAAIIHATAAQAADQAEGFAILRRSQSEADLLPESRATFRSRT